MLVGDAYIDIRQLMVVCHFACFCSQRVTRLGTFHIDDVVFYAEGELPVWVHHRRNGNVSQCKVGPTLAYPTSIQVFGGHHQWRTGIAVASLFEYFTKNVYDSAVISCVLWVSPKGSRLLSCFCFCFPFPEVFRFFLELSTPPDIYTQSTLVCSRICSLFVEEITCPPP